MSVPHHAWNFQHVCFLAVLAALALLAAPAQTLHHLPNRCMMRCMLLCVAERCPQALQPGWSLHVQHLKHRYCGQSAAFLPTHSSCKGSRRPAAAT